MKIGSVTTKTLMRVIAFALLALAACSSKDASSSSEAAPPQPETTSPPSSSSIPLSSESTVHTKDDNSGVSESTPLRIDQMEDQGLLSVEDTVMLSNGLNTIGATEIKVGDNYMGMIVEDVEIYRARTQEQKDMLKKVADMDIEISKAQVFFAGEFTISGVYDATSEGFRYIALDDITKESIPYFSELSESWPLTEIHFSNKEVINSSIPEGKRYLNCKVIAKDLVIVYVFGGSPRNYATFLGAIEYGQAED